MSKVLILFMVLFGYLNVLGFTVSGTVTDEKTSAPLAGVLVELTIYRKVNTRVLTNSQGSYSLDSETGIMDRNPDDTDEIFNWSQARTILYTSDGKVVGENFSCQSLASFLPNLVDGVYLARSSFKGVSYLHKVIKAGKLTNITASGVKYQVPKTADMLIDTVLVFSKSAYTSKQVFRTGQTQNVQLYPRTDGGKPGPGNTGPTGPLLLKNAGVIRPDKVVEGVFFDFAVHIMLDNVTLRNFKVDAQGDLYGVWVEGNNLVMEDGEIVNYSSAGIYGSNFTARRMNIHESQVDAIKPTNNVLIEDCWIHHIGRIAEAHADGVQMVAGDNVTIRGNNFDLGLRNSQYHCSQVIIVQTNVGDVSNITIDDNWINGGGYMIQSRDKGTGYGAPTNVRVRNNIFGTDYLFGAKIGYFAEWSGNTWFDGKACVTGKYPN